MGKERRDTTLKEKEQKMISVVGYDIIYCWNFWK